MYVYVYIYTHIYIQIDIDILIYQHIKQWLQNKASSHIHPFTELLNCFVYLLGYYYFFVCDYLKSTLLSTFRYTRQYCQYNHHTVHRIPRPYSFHNWKSVPSGQHLLISSPPQSRNLQSTVSMNLGFSDFTCKMTEYLPFSDVCHSS